MKYGFNIAHSIIYSLFSTRTFSFSLEVKNNQEKWASEPKTAFGAWRLESIWPLLRGIVNKFHSDNFVTLFSSRDTLLIIHVLLDRECFSKSFCDAVCKSQLNPTRICSHSSLDEATPSWCNCSIFKYSIAFTTSQLK